MAGEITLAQIGLPFPDGIEVSYPKDWSTEEYLGDTSGGFGGGAWSALKKEVASVGQNNKAGAAYNLTQNQAVNNWEKVTFKNLPYRQVSFTWNLTPKSKKEFDDYNNAIKELKVNSAPNLSEGGTYWEYPKNFEIDLQANGKSYFKSTKLVITDININWSPHGHWAVSGKEKTPTSFSVAITFTERVHATRTNLESEVLV